MINLKLDKRSITSMGRINLFFVKDWLKFYFRIVKPEMRPLFDFTVLKQILNANKIGLCKNKNLIIIKECHGLKKKSC